MEVVIAEVLFLDNVLLVPGFDEKLKELQRNGDQGNDAEMLGGEQAGQDQRADNAQPTLDYLQAQQQGGASDDPESG
ncbi:hypothetical protein GCM10022265_00460 [Marinobacter xestospongiae]